MDIDHLSSSFIEDWKLCPYKATEVRQREGVDSSSKFTDFGNIIHQTLDKYYSIDEDIETIYRNECMASNLPDLVMYSDGIKMLKNFEIEEAKYKSDIVAKEVEFRLELEAPDGTICPVVGVIDRIDYLGDGVYEIIDYKTSYTVKERWELKQDIQMAVYDLAFWSLCETNGLFEVTVPPERLILTVWYLRYGKWRIGDKTPDDRRVLADYLQLIYNQVIGTDEPPKKANKYCAYCPFRNDCDELARLKSVIPGVFALDEISDDDLVELYTELKTQDGVLGKRIDEIKKVLRKRLLFADGAIETDAYKISATSKKYKKRELYQVRNLLSPLGVFEDVVSVDNRKLDKIAKANGLEEEVEQITTYSFSEPVISVTGKPAF
jgi:RecB family exonuclease